VIRLGTLGGAQSWARAVNDAGHVVGYSEVGDGTIHAFLYADGHMTDLGTLGGSNSYAYDINECSQIVGASHDAGGVGRATLFMDGEAPVQLTAVGNSSWATGINDAGQIVGTYRSGGSKRAFAYSSGHWVDLHTELLATGIQETTAKDHQ
jgi:probable HAF family extracellular repeat protein